MCDTVVTDADDVSNQNIGNSNVDNTYFIQCYIETLTSTNSESSLTVRGNDGFRFERNNEKCNIFIEDGNSPRNAILRNESIELIISNTEKNDFLLALQAYLNHKKIELKVENSNNEMLTVKKIKLL